MRFTSIVFALLGVAATASAAATLEARDGFPQCMQECRGHDFGCDPNDWRCKCKNSGWQDWFQGCGRDKCHGKDFHGAGQAVWKRCRKANNPWGW
ncbi:hypothetical protein M413DRAFT_443671 [Hebeloma cylindrosporum]|uniref:CFEM domain-containing protein n=1 Tax=Hebeloma cylindrosporum TaxID=76867 RepID=A0A0C2YRW7_HEBCY|nr:hypothetical protein M413DRAFT_443671 [Hebeloma cylindrosporum h7]